MNTQAPARTVECPKCGAKVERQERVLNRYVTRWLMCRDCFHTVSGAFGESWEKIEADFLGKKEQ